MNNKTKLDDLDGKTDELLIGAMDYERFGKDLKRKYRLERTKLICIFGGAAVVGYIHKAFNLDNLLPFHCLIKLKMYN